MNLLRVVLLAAFCTPLGLVFSADPPQKSDDLDDDLKFLNATVKRFEIHDLPADRALENLVQQVLPANSAVHVLSLPEHEPARVNLDLRNVPVDEIIRYIAELDGAYWKVWGREDSFTLQLEKIVMIDDTELFRETRAFTCSPVAAKTLGLQRKMTGKEVAELLARYGLAQKAKALWNPDTGKLIVRAYRQELTAIAGVVGLAEKGYRLLPPTTSKQSKTK